MTIQRALMLNERGDCDVIIVGRGGGSMEDLWAFNDEQLARTCCFSHPGFPQSVMRQTLRSQICCRYEGAYTISGSGVSCAGQEDMIMGIMDVRRRLEDALVRQLESAKKALSRLESSPYLNQPIRLLEGSRQRLIRSTNV